jgi:hypothetical protein
LEYESSSIDLPVEIVADCSEDKVFCNSSLSQHMAIYWKTYDHASTSSEACGKSG